MQTPFIPPKALQDWIDIALATVAERFEVNKYAILSGTRRRTVTPARRVFSGLLRESLGLSYPEIGYLLGQDHTAIMWAHRSMALDTTLTCEVAVLAILRPVPDEVRQAVAEMRRRRAEQGTKPAQPNILRRVS